MTGISSFAVACFVLAAMVCNLSAEAAEVGAEPPFKPVHSIFVSTAGDDKNSGTASQPVVSLKRAEALLWDKNEPSEIVIRKGVYPGGVAIGGNPDAAAVTLPRIVIRPAIDEKTGQFEEVVFDGGMELKEAEAVPGMTGVYKAPGQFQDKSAGYQVWESDTRKRYTQVADTAAVECFPASYFYTEKEIVFHTSDNKPPREHQIGVSRHEVGIRVYRANTTVKGLRFRNYFLKSWSSGVELRGANTTIEDCHTANAQNGFVASSLTSTTLMTGMKVLRCRTDDVGDGVYSNSKQVVVADCRLFKIRDSFMVPAYSQNDSGIQYYSPAFGGEVRRNLCVGFMNGIFIKCGNNGDFVVENNTVLDGLVHGIGSTGYGRKAVFRFNIVTGFSCPILFAKAIQAPPLNIFDYNCFWNTLVPDFKTVILDEIRKVGQGLNTICANPRFAGPALGDYRLLPDSPCLKAGPNGETFGAFGAVEKDFKEAQPPTLTFTLAAPAVQSGGSGELWFERDPWIGGGRNLIRKLPSESPVDEWVTTAARLGLLICAESAVNKPGQMKLRVGSGAWSAPEPYATWKEIPFPSGISMTALSIAVSDAAGNWSAPQSLVVRRMDTGPKLKGVPVVYANDSGAAIFFETDSPCLAKIEFGPDTNYGSVIEQPKGVQRIWSSNDGGEWVEIRTTPRITNNFTLLKPVVATGKTYHYRFRLQDELGNTTVTDDAAFTVTGTAKSYFVSPAGEDADVRGGHGKPWRTIQFAVDRALPGDRIVLLPGLYPGEAKLNHGGLEGAPITIAAEKPGTVILDGRKAVPSCLSLNRAPFVVIDGLEIRWFENTGINIVDSPNVSVSRCRIWNGLSELWPNGSGIMANRSPGLNADQNVIFVIEQGIQLLQSPASRITRNTITKNLYGAALFIYSAANSVCKNNCFAFGGNAQYNPAAKDKEELKIFDGDYNNLGTVIGKGYETASQIFRSPDHQKLFDAQSFEPKDPYYKSHGSKSLTQNGWSGGPYFTTLVEWQQESGKDLHSIFADPMFVDPANNDFRLKPGSPNIGAGENGENIGALGVVEPVSVDKGR